MEPGTEGIAHLPRGLILEEVLCSSPAVLSVNWGNLADLQSQCVRQAAWGREYSFTAGALYAEAAALRPVSRLSAWSNGAVQTVGQSQMSHSQLPRAAATVSSEQK